jgi:ribonuclease D
MKHDWRYIDRAGGLADLCRELQACDRAAVDTESDSMYSYFEKVCLFQIATRENAYVIDPLAPDVDLSILRDFFADPGVTKVLHGANYDVVCLKRDYGFEIRGVFDTMIAAQHLGLPKIGLADLVADRFGARLDKRHARTNWGRRPLDSAELEYSYRDVKYLIELSEQLAEELEEADVREEAEIEFRRAEELAPATRSFDPDGYLRIRGSRDLRPRELAVLRELFVMRDRRARKMNRPPFKVLANDTLVRLSRARPRRAADLEGMKGVTKNVLRHLGHQILKAVSRGIDRGRPPPPRRKPPKGPRLSPRKQRQVEALKQWRKGRAEDRGVPTLVVLPNHAVLEVVVEQPEDLDALAALPTVGQKRARLYGGEILRIIRDGRRR